MSKLKFLLVILGVLPVVPVNAEDVMVAEFSAEGGTSQPVIPGLDFDLHEPGNLYTRELSDSQEATWSIGDYNVSGVLDWGRRVNYLAGEPYSSEHFVYLGSKFQVGENGETYLYYGQDLNQMLGASELYGNLGDAETTRTGLSQTLYFAEQQARLGVVYEYATGDRDDAYQDLEGHEINVSGQVRIGWGFNAHLEAGYGLYSYSEYEGVQGDLTSARTNMRAGISRAFSSNLIWGAHYTYVDEDFVRSDLSQTRQSWGLNLEYRY